jgi:hypothetical protein
MDVNLLQEGIKKLQLITNYWGEIKNLPLDTLIQIVNSDEFKHTFEIFNGFKKKGGQQNI